MKKWSKMHRKVCAAVLVAALLLGVCAGCAAKSGTDDVAQQEQTQTLTQADKNNETADKTAGKDAADKDAAKEDKSHKKDESKTAQEEKKEETKEKTAEELATEQKAKEEEAKKKAAEEAEKKKAEEAAKKKAEAETEVKAEAEQKKQQESTTSDNTCTISISCSTILNNMDQCDEAKKSIVPPNGEILPTTTVSFTDGETVFDVLQRVCKKKGISLEFSYTAIYKSNYIEGIANLYEFDVGPESGWMYKVNDWFPNYGCSSYSLKNGDSICWVYTCNGLGADVGGGI